MLLSPHLAINASESQYRIHKPVCLQRIVSPRWQAAPLPCQTSADVGRVVCCSASENSSATDAVGNSDEPAGKTLNADPAASTVTSSRIFSTLNPKTLQHEPGTVIGSALLVSGTTVGAGILALPAVTQEAGFTASSAGLVGACAYAITTGLLLAEVNISTIYKQGAGEVSIVSMASQTLGVTGTQVTSAAYLFLHYSLLVAYIAKAGEITADTLQVPTPAGAALFATVFAAACYGTSSKLLDQVNGALVVAVVASFLGLVTLAGGSIQVEVLTKADWAALPDALPVMMLAFVYQNVMPVVVANLEGNVPRIRAAICLGVAIPLLMFLSWEAAILGSLPVGAVGVADPLAALRESNQLVAPLIQGFSFLAIATSYIGFILGLTGFLADALQLPSSKTPLTYGLTLAPPFLVAVTYPDLFLKALDIAGTYGVLTIFGLIPAAMAWQVRYGSSAVPLEDQQQLVPGGAVGLAAVAAVSAGIIGHELVEAFMTAAP